MEKLENLYLIGFMGAGKSTIAPKLAERLGMDWVDVDERVEADAGFSIPEIFDYYGEEKFRNLEREAIKSVSEREPEVVAVGGGAPMDDENWERMKDTGLIIYLQIGPQEIYNRIGTDKSRPLLAGLDSGERLEKIRELLKQRHPRYSEADMHVKGNGTDPQKIAEDIAGKVTERIADNPDT
ncbi:MAG: shikimate kinase [Candidatus Bipolaricaulota bacterium]